MISVKRLDGSDMLVNIDLIETIETTPDTLLCLTSGTKLFVLETPGQIVDRVIAFKQAVHRGIDPDAREAQA